MRDAPVHSMIEADNDAMQRLSWALASNAQNERLRRENQASGEEISIGWASAWPPTLTGLTRQRLKLYTT